MTSGEEIDRIGARFEEVQRELLGLLKYVKWTRRTLGASRDELSNASDALASIGEVTEEAAHKLLSLVERAMENDESSSSHLRRLETEVEDSELRRSVAAVAAAQDERLNVHTEMMTELSFQDLTCQTLERVRSCLEELESRILRILDENSEPAENRLEPQVTHSGSAAGLRRLQEKQGQGSGSRQDLIDKLFD